MGTLLAGGVVVFAGSVAAVFWPVAGGVAG
jgi:hypothetical protein